MSSEEVPQANESTAHSILQYCITQAVLKNKSLSSKFQIPYNILKPKDASAYEDVSLEITIDLSWVQTSDDPSVEISYDDE